MFIKIGKRYLNMANVTFIEQVGAQYKVHFTANEHNPLVLDSGAFNDTSHQDLEAWLASEGKHEPANVS